MASPYYISEYLEPVLGRDLAHVISYGVSRELASQDPNVLSAFTDYVSNLFENSKYNDIIEYINKADDVSLYKHIVINELKRDLNLYNGRMDKKKLEEDILKLIKTVGDVDQIEAPMVCGYYIGITIVRVGKLEKLYMGEWERYISYINRCLQKCPNIRYVYMISAGKYHKEGAKMFTNYINSRLENLELLKEITYKARLYKGKPNVPQYIAIFEVKE